MVQHSLECSRQLANKSYLEDVQAWDLSTSGSCFELSGLNDLVPLEVVDEVLPDLWSFSARECFKRSGPAR